MHVHLPKAFHGWREFAKEVGIIVLGVVIALGFEQIVQTWHWRIEARHSREALANEIEYSALWAEERLAVQECLRDRIQELTTDLNGAAVEWVGKPLVLRDARKPIGQAIQLGLPLVYRAPHRPWLSDEWQTAKSSGALDHMDRRDAHNLEFIYRNINQLEALQEEENSLQPQISFLAFHQSLAPESRVNAFVVLARLDSLNAMQAQSARQMLSTIRSANLRPGAIAIGRQTIPFEQARSQIISALRDRYGGCVTAPSAN
jgi:hypothetical protein